VGAARGFKIVLVLIAIVIGAPSVFADGPEFELLVPPRSPPLQPPTVNVVPMPDLAPYLGKPIIATEVVVEESPLGTPTARPITRVKVGDTLTVDVPRAVLLEVLESGAYGDAWVNVVNESGGVRVRVHARVRKLVESVRVDTHGSVVDTEDLLREAGLDEGAELVGSDLDLRTQRMRALFGRRGFPNATVRVETRETNDAGRVLVLIDATPGEPQTLGRRVFYAFGATGDELRTYTDAYRVTVGALFRRGGLPRRRARQGRRHASRAHRLGPTLRDPLRGQRPLRRRRAAGGRCRRRDGCRLHARAHGGAPQALLRGARLPRRGSHDGGARRGDRTRAIDHLPHRRAPARARCLAGLSLLEGRRDQQTHERRTDERRGHRPGGRQLPRGGPAGR